MVVQKTIDNLKQGPKEDKVAVAGGIAISVVAILLIAWALFFFRNIQRVVPTNVSGEVQIAPDAPSVTDAPQTPSIYLRTTDPLQQMGVDAATSQTQTQPDMQQLQGGTSQFGSASTTY